MIIDVECLSGVVPSIEVFELCLIIPEGVIGVEEPFTFVSPV